MVGLREISGIAGDVTHRCEESDSGPWRNPSSEPREKGPPGAGGCMGAYQPSGPHVS